jgi:hypothetical protein
VHPWIGEKVAIKQLGSGTFRECFPKYWAFIKKGLQLTVSGKAQSARLSLRISIAPNGKARLYSVTTSA